MVHPIFFRAIIRVLKEEETQKTLKEFIIELSKLFIVFFLGQLLFGGGLRYVA